MKRFKSVNLIQTIQAALFNNHQNDSVLGYYLKIFFVWH